MTETIRILRKAQLRVAAPLDLAAVDCVEGAFRALAGGGVEMPPILTMAIAEGHGEVHVKTAHLPGGEAFAIEVSPGFFRKRSLGLPSTSGPMVVLWARTGRLRALLLDNGSLTALRTAAAGAVAARHLSRENSSRAAIPGAGCSFAPWPSSGRSAKRRSERATRAARRPARARWPAGCASTSAPRQRPATSCGTRT